MVEEFFVTVLLSTYDLVGEEVGCVNGVFIGMGWSELEDKIE
jgi:hypothetical protein